MTFQKFIEKHNGKYLEVAGSANAKNQCVDLANAYIRDVLGLPIIEWTNAVDFPSRAGDKYEYIKNTPTGVPHEGDLMIFGGKIGHISIFIEGDVNSFRSFDQNYPVGSPCHVQSHRYTNVLGWLRPKPNPQPDPVYVVTPSIDDDHKRAYQVLEDWRKDPKNLDGPEGNFEGFVRRLVGRDEKYSKLVGDLSICRNTLLECQKKAEIKPVEPPKTDASTPTPPLAGLDKIEEDFSSIQFSTLFTRFRDWFKSKF